MQARLTLSGPAGLPASTYLVSVRTGFPGFVVPERESSYLHGESGDLLAKLEVPLFGGRSRLLVYDNMNELGASADPTGTSSAAPDAPPARHAFEWHSRSAGVEWRRAIGQLETAVQAWTASAEAEALWNAEGARFANLASDRGDVGIVASAAHGRSSRRTVAAVRVRASRTRYDVSGSGADTLSLDSRLPVASLFIERQQPVADNLSASLGVTGTVVSRNTYLSPQAVLRWKPTRPFSLSGSYARSHQFAQSLRNAESIIGTVFPADLFVGANAPGVPVARADNVVVAAEVRPADGMRFVAQGYLRKTGGLLLAAPRSSEPFATRAFTTGSGMARGLALEGALSATRYGVVASYGWQRARVVHDTVSYSPEHATDHLFEGGAIMFPSRTSSIRIGVMGAVGRRASGLAGSVENEGCNLLDRGCELAGTPRLVLDRLGASTLPPYLRVDVGARKHWDIAIAGRTATVALFGTVTNVFGRRNVLAVITDPTTGAQTNIGMRPPAPLVVGLDWRY